MDPFRNQARQYLLSRPRYPVDLQEKIFSKIAGSYENKVCLDVACGSGQLTCALAERFGKVIGIDRSQPQLDHATPHSRINYIHVDDCVELNGIFPSNHFDCVTIAQALHWLPLEKALEEFYRVLKPNGTFAALGYAICEIEADSPNGKSLK
jgi:ubiquinone/menaquinone biosynthesis C-methylase UbiE